MPMILSDGTVVPSDMRVDVQTANRAHDNMYECFGLGCGFVVKAHPPSSPDNISRKVWEYDVEMIDVNGNSGKTTFLARNCVTMHNFGGVLNHGSWTLESANSEINSDNQDGAEVPIQKVLSVTCYVYVLFQDGSRNRGVIIGHPQHPDYHAMWSDPHYHWHYRWVEWYSRGGDYYIWDTGPLGKSEFRLRGETGGIEATAADAKTAAKIEPGLITLDSPEGAVFAKARDFFGVSAPALVSDGPIIAPQLIIGGSAPQIGVPGDTTAISVANAVKTPAASPMVIMPPTALAALKLALEAQTTMLKLAAAFTQTIYAPGSTASAATQAAATALEPTIIASAQALDEINRILPQMLAKTASAN